jgi:hypothetical protein
MMARLRHFEPLYRWQHDPPFLELALQLEQDSDDLMALASNRR